MRLPINIEELLGGRAVEPIRGSVPTMIDKTLSYLRTNVVKKKIVKLKDDEHSDKF